MYILMGIYLALYLKLKEQFISAEIFLLIALPGDGLPERFGVRSCRGFCQFKSLYVRPARVVLSIST
jgi:hypothetical protein